MVAARLIGAGIVRALSSLMNTRPHDPAHCTFCNLIRGSAEVSMCYEDSDAIAFMDIQPVNNGHVLVVPRQHYESLLDVPEEIGMHLFQVTMRLAGAIRRVTGCEDLNIVVNSGAAAGQDEPHYHVHIIPRRVGDGFDIPLPFNGSEMPDRTVLDAYAARLISALGDPVRVESSAKREAARDERREPARESTAEPPGESARAAREIERPVSVPLFDESRSPDREPSHAPAPRPAKSDRWRVREGAHGELLYEPNPDAGDAA
jgi:histidine triad (HIT) family protein